jgi:hypothetical protein
MVAGPKGARGAMEIHGAQLLEGARPGRYAIYCVVRVEAEGAAADAPAFQARVFDHLESRYVAERVVKVAETAPGYHSYLVGTVDLNPYSRLWMGHAHDDAVKTVWLDRAILVPAP